MAIVDVAAIRAALAERCRELPGLEAYDYRPDAVQCGPAGAAVIVDAEQDTIAYHQVGSEDDARLLFDVTVVVPGTDAREGLRLLDDYRGVGTERSLVSLLESGGALPGAPGAVTVLSAGPFSQYGEETTGARFWAVTFSVEVRAS